MKKLLQTLYLTAALIGVTPAHSEIINESGKFPGHISKNTLICKDASEVMNMERLVNENDEAAFNTLMSLYVKIGECTGLDAGTPVVVEQFQSDKDNLDIAALCVRQKGHPFCLWTSPATVSDDN